MKVTAVELLEVWLPGHLKITHFWYCDTKYFKLLNACFCHNKCDNKKIFVILCKNPAVLESDLIKFIQERGVFQSVTCSDNICAAPEKRNEEIRQHKQFNIKETETSVLYIIQLPGTVTFLLHSNYTAGYSGIGSIAL